MGSLVAAKGAGGGLRQETGARVRQETRGDGRKEPGGGRRQGHPNFSPQSRIKTQTKLLAVWTNALQCKKM